MFYSFCAFLVRIFAMLFWNIKVEGIQHIPARGKALICSNHFSGWDPILLASVSSRPLHLMGKEEIFSNPVLNKLLLKLGMIKVKRGHTDRRAIREVLGYLEQDEVCGIFPEGTRSKDGELQEFFQGSMYFALKTGAPVVPAVIIGSYGFRHTLWVRFGEPLQPPRLENPERAEMQAWTERLAEAMTELHEVAS